MRPLSLDGVTTYPLAARKSKLHRGQLGRPHRRGASFASFVSGLPQVLAADTLRELASAILRARARRRPIVWGLGAHVIKVGLAPVLIDLMRRGFVTGIALNGAGIVHDFELAVAGATSEDVPAGLAEGQFGMARETGEELGGAVHPTRVIGVSMNTYDLGEAEARDACARAADATGLPCTDPVRFDPAPLLEAVADRREAYLRARAAR